MDCWDNPYLNESKDSSFSSHVDRMVTQEGWMIS